MFCLVFAVLVGVHGDLVGVPGVSVGVLGVLVDVPGVLLAYLMSLALGWCISLHLVFGIENLVFSSNKRNADFCL